MQGVTVSLSCKTEMESLSHRGGWNLWGRAPEKKELCGEVDPKSASESPWILGQILTCVCTKWDSMRLGHRELPGKEQQPGCWELNNNQGPHGPGRHFSSNQSRWKHFAEHPGHLVETPRKAMLNIWLRKPSSNHLSSPALTKLKNKPGKNHADAQEH